MDATMRRERLENLYRVVKAVPAKDLRIAAWFEPAECGTVGCLVGWSSQDPYFRAAGLGLCKVWGGNYPAIDGVEIGSGDECAADLARFFGVTVAEAKSLFLPTGYRYDRGQACGRPFKTAALARIVALIDATPKPPDAARREEGETVHACTMPSECTPVRCGYPALIPAPSGGGK